jgi:hypothetical protein
MTKHNAILDVRGNAESLRASEELNPIIKPKKITAKIAKAIEVLVMQPNMTITEATSQAGLTREHLSRALKEAHVRRAVLDRAAQELPLHALQAPGRIADLARTARSEKVRLEANQDLLNRTLEDVGPAATVVNIQINV